MNSRGLVLAAPHPWFGSAPAHHHPQRRLAARASQRLLDVGHGLHGRSHEANKRLLDVGHGLRGRSREASKRLLDVGHGLHSRSREASKRLLDVGHGHHVRRASAFLMLVTASLGSSNWSADRAYLQYFSALTRSSVEIRSRGLHSSESKVREPCGPETGGGAACLTAGGCDAATAAGHGLAFAGAGGGAMDGMGGGGPGA
eukprot:CAMPEP_0206227752 /NCGR_PEP_ID=MMETSP0047_2-20121206/8795_1 /ASSEMBLY_ACC=CAM_ASM_000192 /TAXON_ID=195065 /ORGANISM="Chroomonas mesostigmatica_cf, Strain CCMP1168" /LENGTH=200 /DNA_ID=CAMNT_0053650933 /DNA_START=165 /DNA_END=767 /DNA_ORIENTATION=+